ncbi:hypothetical protein F7725_015491, partial [Dissostichus mawsoni]
MPQETAGLCWPVDDREEDSHVLDVLKDFTHCLRRQGVSAGLWATEEKCRNNEDGWDYPV